LRPFAHYHRGDGVVPQFPAGTAIASQIHKRFADKEFPMEEAKDLLKTSLEELEKVLSSRSVVGEPIHIDGNTIIPLTSVGFGFGAGGGSGKPPKGEPGEGAGAGTGGGGGIRPVAVLVVNKDGVRLESVKGGAASALEQIGAAIGKAVGRKAAEKGA
jgi:uncharacterized spore protein YtfJ